MERLKQGEGPVPITNEKGDKLLFHLSPNELVYVPDIDEDFGSLVINNLSKGQVERIYKMVSSTGSECHFVRADISSLIKGYDAKTKIGELGSLNKQELSIDGLARIKEKCVKINVDRLGVPS